MANYDLTYEGSEVQKILDTGDELQTAGYIFRGEATPSTVPGTPTERVAYIGGPGTYTNFGSSITVGAGCICVFKYTGSAWSNQVINTGLDSAVNTLQSAITAINNNIGNGYVYAGVATPSTSPVTGKVFYLAVQAGTYTNFGSAVVTAGLNVIKYNGSVWSVDQLIAIDAEPTQGSANLVKSGGVLGSIIQNGSAFDLSAYNAQGGVLATYADLSAALTALNALTATYKKGGMSMKYVQSSDNKYVQARCMAQSFTTDVTQWQGVDEEPTTGSDNLVKSGGVAQIVGLPISLSWEAGGINGNSGEEEDTQLTTRQRTGHIAVNDIDTVIGATSTFGFRIYQYGVSKNYLHIYSSDWIYESKYDFTEELDSDCKYIRLVSKTTDSQTPPIQLENSKAILERLEEAEDDISNLQDDISNLQDSVSELDNTTDELLSETTSLDNTVNSILPIWEAGGIRSDTGVDNNASDLLTTRQRTVGYIKAEYNEIFGYKLPFDYAIMQYAEDKSFIGTIPTAPEYWKTSDWSFGSYLNENCKYIRICSKTTNSAKPTLALKNSNKSSIIYRINELEKESEFLAETTKNLNSDVYGSEEHNTEGVIWEAGSIRSDTGVDNNASDLLTTRQRTVGYISINDCDKVTNYSSPFDYAIMQYAEDKSFIGTIPTAPEYWKTSDWSFGSYLNENCKYIRICSKTTNSAKPTFVLKKTAKKGLVEKVEQLEKLYTDTIIVDANGNGDYTSLADALANAGDTAVKHVTIIVRQGTYLMPPKVSGVAPYEENNRNLTIKGEDKYLCVLYNNIGFYDYTIQTDCAPLRLNGNVRIENLTIISRSTEFDNYVNTEGYVPRDDYRKASYCIHRDGNNAANTKFVVKDCILIDDHMTCIGFGLKPNTELIIENVYAQSEQAAEHSKANDYGTLYGHYKANDKGLGQNLSVIRCQLVNKTSNQAINIMDAKAQDATPQDTFGTFKFIGNAVNTTDKTTSLVIASSNAGFYEIDGLSFDNAWE